MGWKRDAENKGKVWGKRDERRARDKRESERDSEWKRERKPPHLTRLGREVPVRAQCPRQAPGACYSKRHTPHAARLRDGFTIFLTGHDISLGLAAKKTVWQPPADTHLGDTPGPTEGPWLFSTKLGKVCKYDLMQKSRKQLEVNCLNLKRAVRVNNHSRCCSSRGKQRKAGTKSKLALCVCSDVKFCCILVPLPPLAASVSQRIKLQSSARGVFVHHCHSERFLLWESLDRPAVASVHSGIDYYCLKSSTPIDRLSVGTAFSFW